MTHLEQWADTYIKTWPAPDSSLLLLAQAILADGEQDRESESSDGCVPAQDVAR